MKRAITLVFCSFLIFLSSSPANAQCMNSSTPSCGVYETCFAKLCSCESSSYEYFESYGKKYCKTFLQLPGLSQSGKTWRDSTLRCLQEKIVPLLPADGQENTCNCEQMQGKAFDTHVACYTQANKSICDLPPSDWAEIFAAAGGVRSLVDAKSRKQIVEVARICVPRVSEPLRKQLVQFISEMK